MPPKQVWTPERAKKFERAYMDLPLADMVRRSRELFGMQLTESSVRSFAFKRKLKRRTLPAGERASRRKAVRALLPKGISDKGVANLVNQGRTPELIRLRRDALHEVKAPLTYGALKMPDAEFKAFVESYPKTRALSPERKGLFDLLVGRGATEREAVKAAQLSGIANLPRKIALIESRLDPKVHGAAQLSFKHILRVSGTRMRDIRRGSFGVNTILGELADEHGAREIKKRRPGWDLKKLGITPRIAWQRYQAAEQMGMTIGPTLIAECSVTRIKAGRVPDFNKRPDAKMMRALLEKPDAAPGRQATQELLRNVAAGSGIKRLGDGPIRSVTADLEVITPSGELPKGHGRVIRGTFRHVGKDLYVHFEDPDSRLARQREHLFERGPPKGLKVEGNMVLMPRGARLALRRIPEQEQKKHLIYGEPIEE